MPRIHLKIERQVHDPKEIFQSRPILWITMCRTCVHLRQVLDCEGLASAETICDMRVDINQINNLSRVAVILGSVAATPLRAREAA